MCSWETNCLTGPVKLLLVGLLNALANAPQCELLNCRITWSPRLHLAFVDQYCWSVYKGCNYFLYPQPFSFLYFSLSAIDRGHLPGSWLNDVSDLHQSLYVASGEAGLLASDIAAEVKDIRFWGSYDSEFCVGVAAESKTSLVNVWCSLWFCAFICDDISLEPKSLIIA